MYLFETILQFWRNHPALYFGLSLLFGYYASYHLPLLLISNFCLWLPFFIHFYRYQSFVSLRLPIASLILTASMIIYSKIIYPVPQIFPEGLKGTFKVSIDSLSIRSTPFLRQWHYRCNVDSLDTNLVRHLSCSILLPLKSNLNRPTANKNYQIKGTLHKTDRNQYVLKVKNREPWYPILGSWSSAEIRFQAKKAVKKWIEGQISDFQSSLFLAGLATGEFDDKKLSYEFGRFGLQHIMAISGFHFAIMAAILSFFLRMIFSIKTTSLILVILLSLYFLFLGMSASILRAWIMITFTVLGVWFDKRANSLNSLGIALIVIFFVDPALSLSFAFQLSFLITAAILFFSSALDEQLALILTKRLLSEAVNMNRWNQHGYIFLSIFRQALALTLAVNIAALPISLYYFQKFPLMSLIYNFFFPFLVSISMFFLLIGALLPFLHPLNSFYTKWVLQFTHQMPTSVDSYLRTDNVTFWPLVIYLTLIFMGGVLLKQRFQNNSFH